MSHLTGDFPNTYGYTIGYSNSTMPTIGTWPNLRPWPDEDRLRMIIREEIVKMQTEGIHDTDLWQVAAPAAPVALPQARYRVKLASGHGLTVRAAGPLEAIVMAIDTLTQQGHSVEPEAVNTASTILLD